MTPVLIVGAGPAGSVAALVLARAGVHVRLIDRSSFPRDKLCGDTLNPGALAILDRLGLGGRVRARARPISGMTVTGPHGIKVSCDYPADLAGGAIVRRDLDATLVDAAIAAGADFVGGAPVTGVLHDQESRVAGVRVGRHGQRLPACVVIAADGRRSRLAFGLGLSAFAPFPQRWAFGAYFTDVQGVTSHGEMHIRTNGYIGVAGLTAEAVNVCVVREVARRGHHITPQRVLQSALEAEPDLRARFARARQVSPLASLGPLAVEAKAAGCPGLLLAGDAAGFVDPMTGDGLRFALRGGELAAEAALVELETGVPAHRHLLRTRAREFSAKWRINRAIRTLVGSPRGVQIAAALSACWPLPVRYLIGIAGDVPLAR